MSGYFPVNKQPQKTQWSAVVAWFFHILVAAD